jgi:hypothetical protein
MKFSWIGHMLRRNCLLKHVVEGKIKTGIEVTGRQGRRRNLPLDGLKEMRVSWKLKAETLGRPLRRTRFAGGYVPVIRRLGNE